MAILAATIYPVTQTQAGEFLSSNVGDHVIDGGQLHAEAAQAVAGELVNTQPVAVESREITGHAMASFADLWYGRVHVIPASINVGNLVAEQTREIEVFNAYIADERELSEVTEAGNLDGVALTTGAVPQTFAPLQSKFFSLAITLQGSPSFLGTYTFTFDTEAAGLAVAGTRVVAWPFAHNWGAAALTESFAWLTDIITAKKGAEQRRQIRGHERRTVEIESLIAASNDVRENARAVRSLDALLFGWQDRVFALPIWQDQTFLDTAAEAGAITVECDTVTRDFDDGGLCVLWRRFDDYEIAEIETVADDSITLKRGLNGSYAAGVKVFPVRLATMPDNLQVEEITAAVHSLRVVFQIETDEITTRRMVAGDRVTYRGADVYLRKNSATDTGQAVGVESVFDVRDYDTGRRRQKRRETAGRRVTDFRALFSSRAEIVDFLAWLRTRAGRLRGVWAPTYKFDFEIKEAANESASSLRVENFGYSQMYAQHPARRDVAIMFNDGTVLFRRITGSSVDGDDEIISFDEEFGRDIEIDDVDRVSFLTFRRLDQDGVSLAWLTDTAATTAFAFRDLLTTP